VSCIPILNNNTISRNTANLTYGHAGGLEGNFTGVNDIIYGNYAWQNPEIYDGYFMFTYTCCATAISGTGNITSNPLWVNPDSSNFNLQAGSPCIDTGSPNWPLDPDSTRADMGALYFDQSGYPNVSITMTPISLPPQQLNFNVSLQNGEASPQTFDAWIMVRLPNGAWWGPALGPVFLTLSAGGTITRLRTQSIPSSAPAGTYFYCGYVGDYPAVKWDSSGFYFNLTPQEGAHQMAEWANNGESFDTSKPIASAGEEPPPYTSIFASPNPFNPVTVLRYELPDASFVKVGVYDISGRSVAELANGWRGAGIHEAIFDASHLTSGLYLARLQAGGEVQTVKLLYVR